LNLLHPEVLYLLPLLIILFGFLLTQKEAEAHFFSQEVMDKLRVSANSLTLKARNGLFFLIGLLMLVALSGPVINEGTVEVKAKSADIMIALDISDSMLAEDVYPNRLKSAKQKAIELLKMAPTQRIGVMAFAKNSYLVSPLSFDHGAVSFLLSQLSTTSITEKGTDFIAMLNAVDGAGKKGTKKYLLILSDGGDKSDFSSELEYAKEHNIVIYILGIGTEKGAPIKMKNGSFIKQNGDIIISKLNENISDLATKSGGVYIENVNSDLDIKTMLQEIENSADEKELKSEEVQKFIPLFYFPLGLALFILLIATSSMSKRESVSLPSLILLGLLFANPNAEAGLLDFMELDKAKKAYESGNYEESQGIYQKYTDSVKNSETNFNVGNTLYKQKKYKEAIESYKQATFDDESGRANNYANIGNSYVKLKEDESLQKALEAYKKSLDIIEDKDTRENYEAVHKAIEEKKKQEKKNKEDKKQNKKEQKNKDKKEDSKDNQKSDENKDSQDKKDSEQKDSEQKDSSSSDSKDSKDKKSQNKQSDKENQKNDKSKSDEQKKQDAKDKDDTSKSEDTNQTKAEQEKQGLKELDKKEENDSKSNSASSAMPSAAQEQMSDEEERKWLKRLNSQQNTYMYMLNNQEAKENTQDEKPW